MAQLLKVPSTTQRTSLTPKKRTRPLKYVVAVDDSNCSRHAFQWADFIANKKDKITVLHCLETPNDLRIVLDRYGKYQQNNPSRYELKVLDNLKHPWDQRLKRFINSPPRKGKKQPIDILVTGLWGRGYYEKNAENTEKSIGSASDLSLRSARCSSFFVRKDVEVPENQNELRIVVAVDGSQNSLHAFRFATRILAPDNEIFVVHVRAQNEKADVPEEFASDHVVQKYTKLIQQTQKKLKVNATLDVIDDANQVRVSEAVCKYAMDKKCHILCVGADGMTAHSNSVPILGSVSDECVKNGKCNIMVTQVNDINSTPSNSRRGSVSSIGSLSFASSNGSRRSSFSRRASIS